MPAVAGRRTPVLLEVDLSEPPAPGDSPGAMARLGARGRPRLGAVLRALHEAASDPEVVGLIARVGGRLPWAGMQELRLGVQAFAASGKPTLAWAESFSVGSADLTAYVLATAFDQIWLQPGGGLGPLGVAVETTFLRGALDRLGIEPQVQARHEYKSAADRLMRTEFTSAHRAALDRIAESIHDEAIAAIASGRGWDPGTARALADGGQRTAGQARDAGLVDHVGYRDQAYAAMRAQVGAQPSLLFADQWRPRRRPSLPGRSRDHVALVTVRGTITTGITRRALAGRQVGGDTAAAVLRQVAADRRARAVVLRIDSPGGSAVASDTIWREVCRVRDAGKPVVVSMGGVAASGGYYIACPADVIVALPATLTGSIGVVGGKFVAGDLMRRLGLTTGTVAHGEGALMYSARRGFSDEERDALAATLDSIYDDFVAKVAQGRGRSGQQIDAVARGRVWTGSDALAVGLVDRLGGLHESLRVARERGGLPADAPARRAPHVPARARLTPVRNSEDPRSAAGLLGLPDLAAGLLPASGHLLMPPVTVR